MAASTGFRDWRCSCGRLLFRIGARATGQVETKCARCKTAQVVNLGSTQAAIGASSWG